MRRALLGVVFATGLGGCHRPAEATTELWFGGDVHAGARLGALLDSVPLRKDAIGIVNLEGPIAEGPSSTIDGAGVHLKQSLRAPRLLEKAGVRIATLANNHALDGGETGRASTVERLRSAGIEVAFGGRVAVLRGPSTTVSVAAFDLTAGLPKDLRRIVEDSEGVRLVSLHVTAEPSYLPAEVLVAAVGAAVEAGARVVVAHGSHEPARVERRGNAVIAWGLGNLVFDCTCTDAVDGLILAVRVAREGRLEARVLPVHAGLGGSPARPAEEPAVMRQLLAALGSPELTSEGLWFRF